MELIADFGRQRFYKLDKEIKRNVLGLEITPTKYCVVSDAKTHIERLVFPFYFVDNCGEEELKNNEYGCLKLDYTHIGGHLTNMIDGGDAEYVFDDKKLLLRVLADMC